MKGNICVLGQDVFLPVIKHRPAAVLVAPFIGGTNLCKEIVLPMTATYSPYVKYKFSRAKWHTADLGSGVWRLSREYNAIIKWCTEQFGAHPKHQDAWSRWWVGIGCINFRDEKDYLMFLLRWGS